MENRVGKGHFHRADGRPNRSHIPSVGVIRELVPLFLWHVDFAQRHSEKYADPTDVRGFLRLMLECGLHGFPEGLPIVFVRLNC